MEKYVILIPLLMLSCTLAAQKSREGTMELGITTSFSVYNYTFRGLANPHVSWQKDKLNFVIGPTLLVASNVGLNTTNFPKLTGLKSSLRYMPAMRNKRFTFFLSNDIIIQRIVDHWDANAYDERIGNYASFRYRNVEHLIEQYIGYGFKLKFARNWHLVKGVGIGYYLSNLDGDELSSNAPEVENFDYRGYKNFGFSWLIKLGAGISF